MHGEEGVEKKPWIDGRAFRPGGDRPGRLAGPLVFLSAFTLFSFEFYAASALLPVFGGSSHVWTTCMVWYLALVWLGYTASWHLTSGRILVLATIAVLGLILLLRVPLPTLMGLGDVPDLVLALTLHGGVVFFLLSCITPAVQRRVEQEGGETAYHLVAWSNAGSLAAVVGFPFFVQDLLDVDGQRRLLAGLAALVFVGLVVLLSGGEGSRFQRPAGHCRVRWILLSAGATGWMLAITQFVSTEVTAHPLLWAVTLALLLGAYVLAFQTRWKVSLLWIVLPTLVAGGAAFAYRQTSLSAVGVLAHLALLWVGCLVANRALADDVRAQAADSYWFYVSIGLGGALGGIALSLAPVTLGDWFPFSELDYLLALWILSLGLLWSSPVPVRILLTVGLVGLAILRAALDDSELVFAERNFYGLNRVTETATHRFLASGVTVHGVLNLREPDVPLAYYHHNSPAGEILSAGPYPRVLSIGLGAGALLTYLRPGDHWTVIELDPAVLHIAQTYFPHAPAAGDQVTYRQGDGRRVLASLEDRFDLIIVDAFSSDSIPTHLLTREAMALYRDHLNPDGEILFHLSSRYVDLVQVFRHHAEWLGVPVQARQGPPDSDIGVLPSTWVLVGPVREGWIRLEGKPQVAWTDQRCPILPLLRP